MRIAVLSDTHLAPQAQAFNANLNACLEWVRAVRADRVVHLGDITADGLHDAQQLVFAAARLRVSGAPVHVLPGNHDIGDNPPEPGAPVTERLDLARLADHRRAFGADRWSVELPGWQLIGLNCQLCATGSQEEEEQLTWLHERVAASDAPLGLLLHKPLFLTDPGERPVHDRYVPWQAREQLMAMLAGRDLRFVLSGHVHQSRRHRVGSTEHIWLPSTAFCIPDPVQESIGRKEVGVGLLALEDSGHRFEFVTPHGLIRHNVLDHAEVYPQVAAIRERLRERGELEESIKPPWDGGA